MVSSLFVMAIALAAPPAETLSQVRGTADTILAAQREDGAFLIGHRRERVVPYFGHLVAWSLIEAATLLEEPGYIESVEKWLTWCDDHRETDGALTDFLMPDGRPVTQTSAESQAAYAAMDLFLLHALADSGHAGRWVTHGRVMGYVELIEKSYVPGHGLTTSEPGWPLAYLFHNVEVWRGLHAARRLTADPALLTRIESLQRSLEIGLRLFWDEPEGCFTTAMMLGGQRVTGLHTAYPSAFTHLHLLVTALGRNVPDVLRPCMTTSLEIVEKAIERGARDSNASAGFMKWAGHDFYLGWDYWAGAAYAQLGRTEEAEVCRTRLAASAAKSGSPLHAGMLILSLLQADLDLHHGLPTLDFSSHHSVSLTPLRSYAEFRTHHFPISDIPERYESAPDLVTRADGPLIAVYRSADQARADGAELALRSSGDGGQSWTAPHVLARTSNVEAGDVFGTPRITRIKDGFLVVACDWQQGAKKDAPHPINVWFSIDKGDLWSGAVETRVYGWLADRIHETSDGEFLLFVRRPVPSTGQMALYLHRSIDSGVTWGTQELVFSDPRYNVCETSLVVFPDGRWLCFVGNDSKQGGAILVIESADRGKSWSRPLPTNMMGDGPVAGLLADGRLFVTYRNTRDGRQAINAWCAQPGELVGTLLELDRDPDAVWNAPRLGGQSWAQSSDGGIAVVMSLKQSAEKNKLSALLLRPGELGGESN